ncbi:CPBP family intramembrane glutamic endopeptidase [Loigolactobacillus jiayinensis]|mgnify:CR=1 FL=1|uniref:CPBP family intramembrane glutamic endopeptidase n=1 Tax=Loigolactobacillus jiayinensis TaxID=2486016 RepID=A0ABW1RFU2_9LACO|nr:type II CAAX endopeptidase family protein [Loigolactobacillus jiayinensis]
MSLRKNVVATLITYLIVYLLPTVINLVLHLGSHIYWVQTIDYIIGALILTYFYWRTKDRPTLEQKSVKGSRVILWGLLGVIAALAAQYLANMIDLALFHSIPNSTNTATILTVIKSYPVYILATIIAAPIMEELVFRRTIFGSLAPFTGNVGAALIASVMFAMAHNDGHLLVYTAIGLVFCYLYQKTGRIQTSIISHMLMNALVIGISLWH